MLIPFELELTSRISRFAGEWKLCAKPESGNNILDSKILEPSSGKHVVAGFSPRYGAEVVATKTRAKARDYTFINALRKEGSLGALLSRMFMPFEKERGVSERDSRFANRCRSTPKRKIRDVSSNSRELSISKMSKLQRAVIDRPYSVQSLCKV